MLNILVYFKKVNIHLVNYVLMTEHRYTCLRIKFYKLPVSCDHSKIKSSAKPFIKVDTNIEMMYLGPNSTGTEVGTVEATIDMCTGISSRTSVVATTDRHSNRIPI